MRFPYMARTKPGPPIAVIVFCKPLSGIPPATHPLPSHQARLEAAPPEGGVFASGGAASCRAMSAKFPHNGSMFRHFFHTMETCFEKFSTQWNTVSPVFPHNGNMFRGGFPRCGKCRKWLYFIQTLDVCERRGGRGAGRVQRATRTSPRRQTATPRRRRAVRGSR